MKVNGKDYPIYEMENNKLSIYSWTWSIDSWFAH